MQPLPELLSWTLVGLSVSTSAVIVSLYFPLVFLPFLTPGLSAALSHESLHPRSSPGAWRRAGALQCLSDEYDSGYLTKRSVVEKQHLCV